VKILILIVNLLLSGVLVWETVHFFSNSSNLTVSRGTRAKKHTGAAAAKNSVKKPAEPEPDIMQKILNGNIFNVTRCPEAVGGRGGGIASMQLVGIYHIGDQKGAIITLNTRNNFRPGPGGWNNRGRQNTRQLKPQQTFMLGDTMDNGYVVSAIYDDRVELTRGGGHMELRLELASRPVTQARNAAAWRASRPTAQQMQQRMQMDQMMMMRQLMQSTNQMQRQMMNQSANRGGNTRSTRNR